MNANGTQTDHTAFDSHAVFDSKARQAHAAAVANVSAATQAQLHQRRRRALAGEPAARNRGMVKPLAWTGAFALLALAIALPVAMRLPNAPTPATAPVAVTAPVTATTGDDSTIATLDEDPDLYVWLASSDAIALASE